MIDVGSTNRQGQACAFNCSKASLKAVSVKRIFILLGTSSQIFGPKWESDSVPSKNVRIG